MYTNEELNSLIAEVEQQFTVHLAKAEKSFALAKNDNDQPKDKKVNGAADDAKNSAKDEKTSAVENKDGGKSDDSRNAAADEKQENGDASKEASADKSGKPIEGESESDKGASDQHQQQDGAKEGQADEAQEHGYDDKDMQHMHSMYSSMSRGELKAHHDSIRKCMDSHGLAKCEDSMIKSEKDVVVEIEPSQELTLLKSELDSTNAKLEAAKADSEKNKKNLEAVEAFLKKFVEKTAPTGKAITSLDVIVKTESAIEEKPLQKSEIDARLLAKSKDQSTSVSDRNAINSYYCGSKDIKKVSHLLK